MDDFEKSMKFVFKWEGVYVNDPNDPGGETKYGISDRRDGVIDGKADLNGDEKGDVEIKNLSLKDAKIIYYKYYWIPSGCKDLDFPLNLIVFDTAVNCGVSRAKKWLRITKDPEEYLSLRINHYRNLVTNNPKMGKYLKGWLNRLTALREFQTL